MKRVVALALVGCSHATPAPAPVLVVPHPLPVVPACVRVYVAPPVVTMHVGQRAFLSVATLDSQTVDVSPCVVRWTIRVDSVR